jgi:glycosyltransferase involved in cell wall biosynthesis
VIKIKIYTANVPLESSLSYALTMKQVIEQTTQQSKTEKNEWFYASFGLQLPFIAQRDGYIAVPYEPQDDSTFNKHFQQLDNDIKFNLIFMHDDPQRCTWFNRIPRIPIVYWIPWDNEDPNVRITMNSLKEADYVITVAKFALERLKQYRSQIDQIYNPIDTEAYKPSIEAGEAFKRQCNIPLDHKIITWIGRPGWRKRFIHIIEIARRIIAKNPKVHLVIHTDINDPAIGFNLKELLYADDLLKGNAVVYPEHLDYNKGYPLDVMNGIYNATDVYIAPHGGEGMGLPICEAMSCGKPFIATDITTTPEFADYEGRGTLVGKRGIGIKQNFLFNDKGVIRPYADLEDFVKQTEYLLENPDVCKKMGQEGRLFVQKEVDKRVVGAKLKKVFDKFKVEAMNL